MFNPLFFGGVYVAAADLDGDGKAEIIVGAGAGGGPHVKVFSGADGSELASFFAYNSGFFGGVRVGAFPLTTYGVREPAFGTAPGPGGGNHLKIFSLQTGAGVEYVADHFFGDPADRGGVYLASNTTPARPPDSILFDFDNTPISTETQPGYTSVASDQVHGFAGNPFFWDADVGAFDGGQISTPFADLLRDGHSDTDSRTFTTGIVNGWYLVSVQSGDSESENRLRVSNADIGQVLLDNIQTAPGEYSSETFVVQVTDGTLDLQFESPLGSGNPWRVNGLTVRTGEILTIGSPGPVEANGVETTTITIDGVTPDSFLTVAGGLDSILNLDGNFDLPINFLTPDAAPEIQGTKSAPTWMGIFNSTSATPPVPARSRYKWKNCRTAPFRRPGK